MTAPSTDSELTLVREARIQAREDLAFSGRAMRDSLDQLFSQARAACINRYGDSGAVTHFAAVYDEKRALAAHDLDTRRRVDARITLALERLQALPSSGEMSRHSPAELRLACGFTRVMISSARGSRWLPDTIRSGNHSDSSTEEVDRFAQDGNEIPLARMMLETEMMRRRAPVIVEDAETDPRTYKPLIRVTQSNSYIAAPITTNRRVIGFLHADRHGQQSTVTSGDLKSIRRFAFEFGVLFESAVLRERIEGQRSMVADLLAETTANLSALVESPLTLTDDGADPSSVVAAHRGMTPETGSRVQFSRREQEVLTLLSAGATNQAIAQELVLSLDTVKSHVANVMRKLRVSTRAAAVAKHLNMRAGTPYLEML